MNRPQAGGGYPSRPLVGEDFGWIKPNGGSDMPGRFGGAPILTIPPLLGSGVPAQVPPVNPTPPRPKPPALDVPVKQPGINIQIPYGDPGLPTKKK